MPVLKQRSTKYEPVYYSIINHLARSPIKLSVIMKQILKKIQPIKKVKITRKCLALSAKPVGTTTDVL